MDRPRGRDCGEITSVGVRAVARVQPPPIKQVMATSFFLRVGGGLPRALRSENFEEHALVLDTNSSASSDGTAEGAGFPLPRE